MTQEDKDLLLRDLCARLPYEVKGVEANTLCSLNTVTHFRSIVKNIEYKIEHLGFKPYLFPLSSMTEKHKREYNRLRNFVPTYHYEFGDIVEDTELYDNFESIDYLIANHFDYRGLIPLGLAIDCTNLNIY